MSSRAEKDCPADARIPTQGTAALYGDQDDVEEGVCEAPDPEDGAAGATIGSILHCAAWQSRLYGAMALPEGVEHVCEGPLCGTFITRVVEESEEEAGVIVEWERRRQRKRRLWDLCLYTFEELSDRSFWRRDTLFRVFKEVLKVG